MYALKNGHKLKGAEICTLVKKKPKIKKLLKAYDENTSNPKNKYILEERKKTNSILIPR